jgi:Uma2 family endonuclease
MRIYCPGPPSYRYADASIVCGAPLLEGDARDILLNPCAVFEVLSPSTARLDRTVKLLEYQSIPSLREILLVEQDQPHVQQVYRRDDGTWELRIIAGLESKLALASVPAALSLGDLYAQVEFPATEEAIADCED